MQLPILSILIFLPLAGVALLVFLDAKNDKALKKVTKDDAPERDYGIYPPGK